MPVCLIFALVIVSELIINSLHFNLHTEKRGRLREGLPPAPKAIFSVFKTTKMRISQAKLPRKYTVFSPHQKEDSTQKQ